MSPEKFHRICVIFLKAVFLMLHNSHLCGAYTDYRNTSCVNPTMKESLPSDRTEWGGQVELTIECDEGYDLPLNSPPTATYTCKPDGSPWEPSYIPDCNVKKFVSGLTIDIVSSLTMQQCQQISSVSFKTTSIKFGSGGKFEVAQECKKNKLIKKCTVTAASLSCNNKNPMNPQPQLAMTLFSPYSNLTNWSDYTVAANNLAKSIAKLVKVPPEQTTATLGVKCDNTTIGVVQEGVRAVCRGCSLGHYLDSEKKVCVPCRPGYYADEPFKVQCKICPVLSALEEDSPLWSQVNKVVSDRSFSIALCPSLHKNAEGEIEVRSSDYGGAIVQGKNPGGFSEAYGGGTRDKNMATDMIVVVVGVTVFVLVCTAILNA